jgi:hypothetical protein
MRSRSRKCPTACITTKKVTIERGDKKIVSVTFEPRPPGAQDLPKLQVSVEAVLGDPRFRE